MDDYAPNHYKLIKRIGEGVHGVVIRAIDLTNNKDVAIKKIPLRTRHGDLSINAIREIKVLQYCDHKNILSLLDIFPDASGMGLVFEYMPCTLHSKIKDPINRLSRSCIRSYMKMLIEGLKYMHNLGIMHRDIKPANLLINCNNQLKIADFGLSRVFDISNEEKCYSPQVASRWYRAPELLWGSSKYGPTIDIWASGCVFAEMLRGIPLFKGKTDIEQLAIVIQTLGSPTIHSWPDVTALPDYNKISFPPTKRKKWELLFPSFTKKEEISLIDSLVKYDPKKRLSAKEIILLTPTSFHIKCSTLNKKYCIKVIQGYTPIFTPDDKEVKVDFNAKLGKRGNEAETTIGNYSFNRRNDRGDMLLNRKESGLKKNPDDGNPFLKYWLIHLWKNVSIVSKPKHYNKNP